MDLKKSARSGETRGGFGFLLESGSSFRTAAHSCLYQALDLRRDALSPFVCYPVNLIALAFANGGNKDKKFLVAHFVDQAVARVA